MKNYILYILLFCTVACGVQPRPSSGSVDTPPQAPAKNDIADFLQQIRQPRPFTFVKIQSVMDIQTNKAIPEINATIYIENGKKIWANLSALFFTIARGQATPSGFQAYEKMGGTYIDSDYAYLRNLLKAEFIDYTSLQNLLTGRTFVPLRPENLQLTTTADGRNILKTIHPEQINLKGKTETYTLEMIYSPENDLLSTFINQINSPNRLEVSYSNWQQIAGSRFPKTIQIEMRGDRTERIKIENTTFDPVHMDTPFAIPSNYTKKEIK